MTLIKTPFKKKRSTIAGDGKRSPSVTPRSPRGSTTRSSLGSSVNSYEESELVVACNINASTKNIYADIDDVCDDATNQTAACDQTPPELPAANPIAKDMLNILQVSTINECDNFEECVEVTEDDLLKVPGIEHKLNCSKNNLLYLDDHLMTTSIDNHLNNIELINKNLDKLMETHEMIDNEEDDAIPPELKAEKKKMKAKIAEKIQILKEARMMSSSSGDKETFKSRVKKVFPKFEKQPSQDDDEKPKEKSRMGKGFLSSFKKKSVDQPPDETEDDFEEIKKIPSDLDVAGKVEDPKAEKFSSKFKHKFKLNIKSTKDMIASKMGKKTPPTSDPPICRRCAKKISFSSTGSRIHPSKAVFDFNKEFHTDEMFDNDFCACVDVFDEYDDDGICIKNFEYKDVSVRLSLTFYLRMACGS